MLNKWSKQQSCLFHTHTHTHSHITSTHTPHTHIKAYAFSKHKYLQFCTFSSFLYEMVCTLQVLQIHVEARNNLLNGLMLPWLKKLGPIPLAKSWLMSYLSLQISLACTCTCSHFRMVLINTPMSLIWANIMHAGAIRGSGCMISINATGWLAS